MTSDNGKMFEPRMMEWNSSEGRPPEVGYVIYDHATEVALFLVTRDLFIEHQAIYARCLCNFLNQLDEEMPAMAMNHQSVIETGRVLATYPSIMRRRSRRDLARLAEMAAREKNHNLDETEVDVAP